MWTKHKALRSGLVMAALSALVVFVLAASVALGGDLDVNPGAAFTGTSFGLEVTPSTCTGMPNLVLTSGTVSTDQAGCETITASNVEVVAPGSVFSAGQSMSFGTGFAVNSAATFVAEIDSAISQFAYVADNTPANETSYQAMLEFHLNDVSIGASDEIVIFVGISSSGAEVFRVVLLDGGFLRVDARLDNGTWQSSSPQALTPMAWNSLELDFRTGSTDGYLRFGIDTAAAMVGLESLANSTRTVDLVRLGAVDALNGVIGSASGSYFIDEFSSFR